MHMHVQIMHVQLCRVTLSVYVTCAHAFVWGGHVTIPDASIESMFSQFDSEADFAKGLSRMDHQRDNPEPMFNGPLITNSCGRWAKLYGTSHHHDTTNATTTTQAIQNSQAFAAQAYQVSLACY